MLNNKTNHNTEVGIRRNGDASSGLDVAEKRLQLWRVHTISQSLRVLGWVALPAALVGLIYDFSIHSLANVITNIISVSLLMLVAFWKKVPFIVK